MRKLFLVSITLLGFISAGCSSDGVLIYLGNNQSPIKIMNRSQTLSQALEGKGLKISEIKNKYEPSISWDSKLTGHSQVELSEKPEVTLFIQGHEKGVYRTSQSTVREFLAEQKIFQSPCDRLNVPVDTKINHKMKIRVDRLEQIVRKEIVNIPFKTREEIDPQFMSGCRETKIEGKTGKDVYRITESYLNGKPLLKNGKHVTSRMKISSTHPVTKVILIGTNKSFKTLTVQSTAYSYTGSRTATGKIPKKGTIAVDPRVIPLGTKLYIPGYGNGVAEDKGGKVKGPIIDLFFHSRSEAMKWGRRTVTIKIVG